MAEIRSVVNTSLRDLHVLFYDIRYVGKFPAHEF